MVLSCIVGSATTAQASVAPSRSITEQATGFFLQQKGIGGQGVVDLAKVLAPKSSIFDNNLPDKVLNKLGLKPTQPITPKHPLFKKNGEPQVGDIVLLPPKPVSSPMNGEYITKGYPQKGEYKRSGEFGEKRGKGRLHKGWDIFSPNLNEDVDAVLGGVVKFVGEKKNHPSRKYLGYHAVVRSIDGSIDTIFGHMKKDSSELKIGDTVIAGKKVGEQGNTGYLPNGKKYPYHTHVTIIGNEASSYYVKTIKKNGIIYLDPEGIIEKLENQTFRVGVYAGDGEVVMAGSEKPIKVAKSDIKGTISMTALLTSNNLVASTNDTDKGDKFAQVGDFVTQTTLAQKGK